MDKKTGQKAAGFTRVELIVVIVICALLVLFVLPTMFATKVPAKSKVQRIVCVNNLKQIGIAYRVWANDNNDLYPAQVACTNGGWKDFLTNGAGGKFCWTNYAIMHTELGESPKLLECPADERQGAQPISSSQGFTGNTQFNNKSVSYFVGVGARENFPQSILGGDRNLCPGTKPDKKYGYSPDDGSGNDVIIATNSRTTSISWSLKMHSKENKNGAGDVLFGDSSVQMMTTARFRKDYQPYALDSGNFPVGYTPKEPSFRLVFP